MTNTMATFRHGSMAWRGAAWLFCVACVACASGRGNQDYRGLPGPEPQTDTMHTVSLNRRIQAAAARESARNPLGAGNEAYRIGPNDQIDITVFGADAFSGQQRVEESGEITIPLLGSVVAAGRTPRELESDLEDRLRKTYMRDPHVSVQVTEMKSHGVSVVGAVGAPGVVQIPGPTSLLEVLAMAQGVTPEAGNRVYVIRSQRAAATQPDDPPAGRPDSIADAVAPPSDDSNVIDVDLGALLDGGDTSQNVVVQAGDIVQVQPAGLVYVAGDVNRPGGFAIPAGETMNVLQALAMAQGFGQAPSASNSVIVRKGPDGRRQEIPVDMDAVVDGDQPPPVMEPRDVLFVPKNGAKAFALGAVDAFVRMVTLRGLFY